MDFMTELAAIVKAHGGIIETKIAAQYGISKAMLDKLCNCESPESTYKILTENFFYRK